MTTRPRRRGLPEDLRDIFKRIRYLEGLKVIAAADESGGGPGVEDLILAESAVGLWKLNELSGTTAADSSGNGNDMLVPTNYLPPTWAQVAGPPGTPSAQFVPWSGIVEGSALAVTLAAALTNNFSAGVWLRLPDVATSKVLVGQGVWQNANSWTLWWDGNTGKMSASMGATNIASNNTQVIDTWYLVGLTRDSGTTTLYVDGLAQTATTGTAPGTSNTNTWIGQDTGGGSGADGENAFLSWAFITDAPISGADWLAIYEAGQTGGALDAGLVWTSDGLGGASWEPPTIEVTY